MTKPFAVRHNLQPRGATTMIDGPRPEPGDRPDRCLDHGGGPGETPHLVIKRGHLGRYRFSFFFDGGRLSGDVRLDKRGTDRAGQDAEARAEIRKIVAALMETLA